MIKSGEATLGAGMPRRKTRGWVGLCLALPLVACAQQQTITTSEVTTTSVVLPPAAPAPPTFVPNPVAVPPPARALAYPNYGVAVPPPFSTPTVPPPPPEGAGAVTAVGTPTLIALKVPLCVATLAIAAPGSAISAMVPTSDGVDGERYFAWGVARNCGPPWVVQP
jgi:hypothetical protein